MLDELQKYEERISIKNLISRNQQEFSSRDYYEIDESKVDDRIDQLQKLQILEKADKDLKSHSTMLKRCYSNYFPETVEVTPFTNTITNIIAYFERYWLIFVNFISQKIIFQFFHDSSDFLDKVEKLLTAETNFAKERICILKSEVNKKFEAFRSSTKTLELGKISSFIDSKFEEIESKWKNLGHILRRINF